MKEWRHLKMGKRVLQVISIVLMVATIAIISIGYTRDKKDQEKLTKIADTEEIETRKKEAQYNLYDKIRVKEDISVLVMGDSIGDSDGASADNKWFDKLKNWFITSKGTNASIQLMTQPGKGIDEGIKEYTADKGSDYDLIFLVYGQSDRDMDADEWSKKYETLVKDVMANNPKAKIMPIIESSFLSGIKNKTSIPDAIEKISNQYGLKCIDMRAAFNKSKKIYWKLTTDGVHPNDDGYAIYAQTIEMAFI